MPKAYSNQLTAYSSEQDLKLVVVAMGYGQSTMDLKQAAA
jgi:hypothetical protein